MSHSLPSFNSPSNEYWEGCVSDGARCDPIYQTWVVLILINASAFKKNLTQKSNSTIRTST